jgi:hypothetical protein
MKKTKIDLSQYKDKFDEMAYLFWESDTSRFERMNKRLCVVCIVLAIALIVSNVLWMIKM